MTTKEYLGQISRLNRMINNKLTEIAQLKDMAVSISATQSGERVQTTPNFDKIGTKYAKIDEMDIADVKKYLKDLIRDNMVVGMEIIKGN